MIGASAEGHAPRFIRGDGFSQDSGGAREVQELAKPEGHRTLLSSRSRAGASSKRGASRMKTLVKSAMAVKAEA
jgi:hypothetical protein